MLIIHQWTGAHLGRPEHLPIPHEQREDEVSRCHSAGGRGTARPGADSHGDASTAPTASRKQPAAKPQQQPVVTSRPPSPSSNQWSPRIYIFIVKQASNLIVWN